MPPIRHEKRGNKVHHKTPMAHPHHHSENKASPQGKVVGPADETNRLRDLALIIKDFRKNLTCGICIRPLYEPYTNPCGHTFCYSCLNDWFSTSQAEEKRRTCPSCRAIVKSQPAPAFLIRDLAGKLIPFADVLGEEGDSCEAQVKIQEEEAALVERDKGRLFGGKFTGGIGARLRDPSDLVNRCPNCLWEVPMDEPITSCENCSFIFNDSEGEGGPYPDSDDDSPQSLNESEDDSDIDEHYEGGLPHLAITLDGEDDTMEEASDSSLLGSISSSEAETNDSSSNQTTRAEEHYGANQYSSDDSMAGFISDEDGSEGTSGASNGSDLIIEAQEASKQFDAIHSRSTNRRRGHIITDSDDDLAPSTPDFRILDGSDDDEEIPINSRVKSRRRR